MPSRYIYIFGFFIVVLLLGISAYLETYQGIMPCPLCSLQRGLFAFIGICFLIGVLVYSKSVARRIVDSMITVSAVMGIIISGRQVWLQHFPSSLGDGCGVSLQYMFQALPWQEALMQILIGGPECSKRGWQFLSLNMAEWSLICFVLFMFFALYLSLKSAKE